MRTIGITGGIASGKSLIASALRNNGFTIIDADVIAREVVEIGRPALVEIAETFGTDYLLQDGHLNRSKLGALIFSNEAMRHKLNAIIHPYIRQEMRLQKSQADSAGQALLFMDIPLLYENQLVSLVDQVLVVYVSREVQLQRLMARDSISESAAQQRIDAQMPLADKKMKADFVVFNNGEASLALKQLELILDQLQ